jgi:CBS domain-containing protein
MTTTVLAILKRKGHRVITVTPDHGVADVANLLASHRIGCIPVVDSANHIIGMISERDIVRGISEHGGAITAARVASLMTTEITTCTPTDTVAALMGVMTERRIRHLPVIWDGQLHGMISIGDLVKARLDEAQQEVEALRSYIAS